MAVLTLGAYEWSTDRGVPAVGRIGFGSDPIPGYANVLFVSGTDRYGNDRLAILSSVTVGDTLVLDVEGGPTFLRSVVGDPAGAGSAIALPIVLRSTFTAGDEPHPNQNVLLRSDPTGAAGWPTVDELAQVLDVDNVSDWQTTLDRVLLAAIDTTKSVVGVWQDGVDVPDQNIGAAALRMAELMSLRPDATVDALTRDAAFRAYLTGKHRRFGIA